MEKWTRVKVVGNRSNHKYKKGAIIKIFGKNPRENYWDTRLTSFGKSQVLHKEDFEIVEHLYNA